MSARLSPLRHAFSPITSIRALRHISTSLRRTIIFAITVNTYALTTVTHQRRALFVRTANAELLLQILFRNRDLGRFFLHGFAIMPEHLHVLITPSARESIERCAQFIKGGFSHAVRAQFRGEVWQPGFHEHRIRNSTDFSRHLDYIEQNPVRRGLAGWEFVHSRWLDSLDPNPAIGARAVGGEPTCLNPF